MKNYLMSKFTQDELYVLLKCVRLCEIDYGECSDIDNVKYKLQEIIEKYNAKVIKCCHCEKCGYIQFWNEC